MRLLRALAVLAVAQAFTAPAIHRRSIRASLSHCTDLASTHDQFRSQRQLSPTMSSASAERKPGAHATNKILAVLTALFLGSASPQRTRAHESAVMDKVQVEASGRGVATHTQEVEMDSTSLSLAPLSLADPKAALCLDEHPTGTARQPAIGPAFAVLAFGSGIFLLRTVRTQDAAEHEDVEALHPTPRAYSRAEIEGLLRVPWRPGGPATFGGRNPPTGSGDSDNSSSEGAVDGPEPGDGALAGKQLA